MDQFDYIIIGSGFGGSVSAMRLAEKGYKVAVLERGRRFEKDDFPKSNWDVRRYLWAPFLKCFGIQNITLLKNALILSGTGVGGGSLVYANTLLVPGPAFFQDPAWSRIRNWQKDLAPHYAMAQKMLGVTRNPRLTEADDILKDVGRELGCENTFHSVDVGVYFGEKGVTVPDPFFGGKGPERTGCQFCGGCMVGCKFNAKNTLDKNYLYFAEKSGAQIFPETEVVTIKPVANGYELITKVPGSFFGPRKTWRAPKIILSGGVLGSVRLLLKSKHIDKTLPHVSDELGKVVRTNGESLVGATAVGAVKDYTDGVAISSAIHPDAITKIEIVRYPKGSDFMRTLALPLTGNAPTWLRPLKFIATLILRLPQILRLAMVRDWATNTIILLVMQTVDNQIALGIKRPWYKFFRKSFGSVKTNAARVPAYIAVAHKASQIMARKIGGVAQNAFSEPLLNTPATAHILGGAKIGATIKDGVVDERCEVFNYPGLYVIDGSIIPANLGVNPSLTITALAEHAMAQVPQAKI